MRLHRMEVTAFGPYRDRQEVDFDELGADGLFLLHGDTGAGKTTVLDAVAFALYGDVPGVRSDAKRFRCDTADPSVPTAVALELSVQGYRFRVERSPEYERPKRRGEGTTKQQAKASLTWLGEAPDGLPAEGLTRIDEVGRTVERLLGMTKDQFVQVVMLPQGRFAQFLQADTKDREVLLEQLFGTQRFAAVEEWFRERRKRRRAEVQERRQDARELLAQVKQAAGAEPDAEEDERSWLENLEKRLTKEYEDATAEQTARRRERDVAERTLTERKELADRVRRVHQARDELAALDEQRATHAQWRAEKEAAERAIPVLVRQQAAEQADAELHRALEEVAAAEADCPDLDAETPVERLRELASEHRERAGALTQLLPEVQQQETDREQLTKLAARIAEDERAEAALTRQQAELPERITAARAEVDAARDAGARLDAAETKVRELDELLAAARELPKARAELDRAADAARRSIDEHQQARDRLQELRQRRLAGMAAELAGELERGVPCGVCGSTEHPAPASPVEDAVSAEDEEQAQQREHAAQASRDEAARVQQQAEHAYTRLHEQVGERDQAELAAERSQAIELRDDLRQRAQRLDELTDQLAKLESSAERLNQRIAEASNGITAGKTQHAALQSTIEEREERLRQARGEYPGIAERRAALLAEVTRLERLATARLGHEDAARRAATQRDALNKGAVDAGFPDVESALAARRDEQRRTELAEALANVDKRAVVARNTLSELSDVDPDVEIGLADAEAAAAEARQAVESASARARGAEQRCADVARLAERMRGVWSDLGPALAEFDELDALTDVVNGQGQNSRKMALRSYVLAARLEEVAVEATHRLQRMSEGRYSFVHSDAAGPRGTRGGLGLEVLDDYSGRRRPAKTLSGGESFLASLSLALGLADVVAGETGGALLDTLFIDEGFGTLDGDTLDLVMNTLDDLRAGGRVIGLVSHVEELRQRIGVRLRVRKSRSGSTLVLES